VLARHSLWRSTRRQGGVCHEPAKALPNRLGRHTGHRLACSFRGPLELGGKWLRKRDLQAPAQQVARCSSWHMRCAVRSAATCFLCVGRPARPTDWPTCGPNRTPVHLVCPSSWCRGRRGSERSPIDRGKMVRDGDSRPRFIESGVAPVGAAVRSMAPGLWWPEPGLP
jgi:hypothetical protein